MAAALNSLAAGISLDDRKRGISMWPRWLVPRFSIRTLLLAVAAIGVGLWSYLYLPDILRNRQDRLSRAAIDPYELSIAGNGNPAQAPPELVAILGDSRLKHWSRIGRLHVLSRDKLLSHGEDQTVRLWEISSGKQKLTLPAVSIAVSRDGTKAFLATPEGRIEIWDFIGEKRLGQLPGHPGKKITFMATDKSGTVLLTGVTTPANENELKFWDARKGTLIREDNKSFARWYLSALAVNEQGTAFAASAKDVEVYDFHSGTLKYKLPRPQDELGGGIGVASHLTFTWDDKYLATGDTTGQINLWNNDDGSHYALLPGRHNSIRGLALGDWLIAADADQIRCFTWLGPNMREWGALTAPNAHFGEIASGHRWIAGEDGEHFIRMWEGREPYRLTAKVAGDVQCLAFSPDGRWLATGASSGEITVWNALTWKKVVAWAGHVGRVRFMAFSPDNSILASYSDHKEIVFWNPKTGAELRTIRRFGFNPFAFSPAGDWIVSQDLTPGGLVLRTWKIADGTTGGIGPVKVHQRGQIAVTPDGDRLVLGDSSHTLSIVDLKGGAALTTLGPSSYYDVSLAVHPDGRRVVAHPQPGVLDVWDIVTKRKVLSPNMHQPKAWIHGLAIHPGGKWVASGANDGTACVWEIDTGKIVKQWQLGPPRGIIRQVAFSPDGRYLATVNGNGTAYILRVDGLAGKSHSTVASSGGN